MGKGLGHFMLWKGFLNEGMGLTGFIIRIWVKIVMKLTGVYFPKGWGWGVYIKRRDHVFFGGRGL